MASFVWVERSAERRGREPLLRFSTLRDGGLRASLVASARVSTVLMTTLVVGPFHLSIALGLDASTIGLVMSSGPIVAALVTSITSAFFVATRASGARWSSQRLDGLGLHTQLAYAIGGRVEPVLRHALRAPSGGDLVHELSGGLNLYLRGRAFVIQSSVGVRLFDAVERSHDVRFQMQLGLAL